MRVLLLIVFTFSLFAQEEKTVSHYQEAMAFKSSWVLYKNAPDNYASYRAFLKSAEKLEDSELKAGAYAYAALGAYLQGKVEYGTRTYNSLNELAQNIGDSKWLNFCSVDQFGDECSVCEGSAKNDRACKKCNGTKTCRNAECRKGQIIKLERVGEKFEEVSSDCPVCDATGFCQTCGGSGVYKIPCNICRSFGYLLNKMKVREQFKSGLTAMNTLVDAHLIEGFEKDQLAKGKIKRGDRYYTAAEIEKMDTAARLKNERTNQVQRRREDQKREQELRAKMDKKFKSLEDDSVLAPEKAKRLIENDFSNVADPVKKRHINTCLKQADLMIKAKEAENKGLELEAIKWLKEAQKLREHEAIKEKIKKLKLESIGL